MRRDDEAPKLTFVGGAGTVTGSKYLVEHSRHQLLLDCGVFQGLKELRLRNWAEPTFNPVNLNDVVLSHAHLDHSGYLPLLARRGFRGTIHCTAATADLLEVVLRDSAHLQEEDAALANRHGYSKHHPAKPLYEQRDVEQVLKLLKKHRQNAPFSLDDSLRVVLREAGHILGASTIDLEFSPGKHLVFSGDLGRPNRPILRDPEFVTRADVLLLESTYGDRQHSPNPQDRLATIITETFERGGALIVPSFAIGRTQELLWWIRALEEAKRVPSVSVFLDSPMAIDVTEIYLRHPECHDLEMKDQRNPFATRESQFVRTPQESKALNSRQAGTIIIAGSGMATGGRVLHHLKVRLPDARNTVLLPGFQAAGTRGRQLQDGAKEVRIHGEQVPVRARVEVLDGLSAHADQRELLGWLKGFTAPPAQTWLVHGEPSASKTLAEVISKELGWKVGVAVDGATVPLFS